MASPCQVRWRRWEGGWIRGKILTLLRDLKICNLPVFRDSFRDSYRLKEARWSSWPLQRVQFQSNCRGLKIYGTIENSLISCSRWCLWWRRFQKQFVRSLARLPCYTAKHCSQPTIFCHLFLHNGSDYWAGINLYVSKLTDFFIYF